MPIEPDELDTATLASVAGASANELLLSRIRAQGHPAIRIAHGYVFQHLLEGDPTVGELAAALDVTQQAVSKTARELEELGYVTRRADPADRRVTRLELTRAGRSAVGLARSERSALEQDLEQSAGAEDVAAARRVLRTLLDLTGGDAPVRQRRVRPPDGLGQPGQRRHR